jgi:hypothetical protein
MSIGGWAVLDQFVIQKGLGHYDWDELINGLIGYAAPDGEMGAMPVSTEDIGGAHMTGVEADAMWEAIYQGESSGLSQQDADILYSGPNGPYGEAAFIAAKDKAVRAGAASINQAIELSNQKAQGKYEEAVMRGKPPKDDVMPLPLAFTPDGQLTPEWRNGVAGKMNKKQPFQVMQDGTVQLRTINRDQYNRSPESWARPYHEGLKELRGGGNTREYIESHRLHPNSVYIDNEGHKAIRDMMHDYARRGTPLTTPEAFKQAWVEHPTLRNKMPHFGSAPIPRADGNLMPVVNRHNFGIRQRSPHPQVAEQDEAEAMVEAQNGVGQAAPADPLAHINYFLDDEELTTSKNGRNLLGSYNRDNRMKYGGGWSNKAQALALYNNIRAKAEKEGRTVPGIQELVDSNPGGSFLERVMRGGHGILTGDAPPQAPLPQEPPQVQPQPAQPTISTPIEEEPPVAPRPAPAPIPPANPVPQRQPAAPVPQRNQNPPIPTRQAPQDLNANQVQSPPLQQSGEALQSDRRGIMDRIGQALGSGAASVANLFTREEIQDALESVQVDMALQDQTIIKMIPHISMDPSKGSDIAFMAGQTKRPASDVVAILNSKGDWREMSKSMDVPFEVIQLVKVAFR